VKLVKDGEKAGDRFALIAIEPSTRPGAQKKTLQSGCGPGGRCPWKIDPLETADEPS